MLSPDLSAELLAAAENGHLKVVRMLLQAGANPNHNDNAARKIACQYGHLEVVRVLLEFDERARLEAVKKAM